MFKNNAARLNGKHTFYDYGLYVTNTNPVAPPTPRLQAVVVPGRDGAVDLTEALTGCTVYENREITLALGGKKPVGKWPGFMSSFLNELHGRRVKVVFDDDPGYYYVGRAVVEPDFNRGNEVAAFTVTIQAEPYKQSILDSMEPWKWSPFSFQDGVIRGYYHLAVNGTRTYTIIGSRQPVVPVFEVSAPMTVDFEGKTYALQAGKNKLYEIAFGNQEYALTFTGTGTVSVSFRERRLLMYRVTVVTDGIEYLLHDPRTAKEQIYDDELSETMGRTPTFQFYMAPDHPNADKLYSMTSEIFVWKDENVEFFGRVMNPETDIYNTHHVECIGGMSYLADSIQAPFSLNGTVFDFLNQMLQVHNSMVESKKQMKLGTVNVAGREAARTTEEYQDTLSVLFQQLVEVYGGYLRVRCEKDGRYLDYLNDYGGFNQQEVRFGENVLDISRQIRSEEVITVLIPEGGEIETSNADGTTGTRKVNISDVNGGLNYIQDDAAVMRWGKIWGYAEFGDITDSQELLKEARKYLEKKASFPEIIELTALDLSLVDVSVEALKIGKWTRFVSSPHGLSGTYLLEKLVRHLTAPERDTVSFGGVRSTLSGIVANNSHVVNVKIEKVRQSASKEISQKVENATNLITGGLGGYFVIGLASDGHPEETLWMDAPDKLQAKNIIRMNKNGIGFSTAGYAGPYRNAWTIDGNLVADFITTGSMLADRIRGGTLEVGGSDIGKDGVILIKDAAGNIIGQLSKEGIRITNGYFSGRVEVGGVEGGIIAVYDANKKLIGYWDKTGLHAFTGVIQGVSFSGGSINIGNGIFVVGEDGSVSINSGEIDIGNIFYAGEDHVMLGDYTLSNDGTNIFRARDGSVALQTADGGPFGDYPVLVLQKGEEKTILSCRHLETSQILGKRIFISETAEWGASPYNGNVGTILDYIWADSDYGLAYLGHEVRSLQSQVDELYEMISSQP